MRHQLCNYNFEEALGYFFITVDIACQRIVISFLKPQIHHVYKRCTPVFKLEKILFYILDTGYTLILCF